MFLRKPLSKDKATLCHIRKCHYMNKLRHENSRKNYKSKFLYVYLRVFKSKISNFLHLKLVLKRATSQDVILN
jgi:hypothetical protein